MSNLIRAVVCCLAISTLSFTAFAVEEQSTAGDMSSDEIQATTNGDQPSDSSMSEETMDQYDEEQSAAADMSEEVQVPGTNSQSSE